jgi:hypothetical protein
LLQYEVVTLKDILFASLEEWIATLNFMETLCGRYTMYLILDARALSDDEGTFSKQ